MKPAFVILLSFRGALCRTWFGITHFHALFNRIVAVEECDAMEAKFFSAVGLKKIFFSTFIFHIFHIAIFPHFNRYLCGKFEK